LYYVVATILLAIKGDHTAVPLPMLGVLRQRDLVRALLRIAIDVKVQDCLVASEVRMVPDMQFISIYGDSKEDGKTKTNLKDPSKNLRMFLSEAEVLRAFPNLIPLT
jgi:ribosome-binding factor A